MDDDISQILKDLGFASATYKKCIDSKNDLFRQLKLLKNEMKKVQDAEKNQNGSLIMSRKLIAEQQGIISKLISVKEEIKLYQEEVTKKNKIIEELQEEKAVLFTTYHREQEKLIQDNCNKLESTCSEYENIVNQLKRQIEKLSSNSYDTLQEYNSKIEQINAEKDKQIESLVLENDEQLRRAHAHVLKMRDELQSVRDKSRNEIAIYKKKIEELQNQNKDKNLVMTQNKNNFSIGTEKNDNYLSVKTFECNTNNKKFKPLPTQFKNPLHAVIETKTSSKTIKRKLFNKDTEFVDENE